VYFYVFETTHFTYFVTTLSTNEYNMSNVYIFKSKIVFINVIVSVSVCNTIYEYRHASVNNICCQIIVNYPVLNYEKNV
jgi:hypothetical protein